MSLWFFTVLLSLGSRMGGSMEYVRNVFGGVAHLFFVNWYYFVPFVWWALSRWFAKILGTKIR